MILPFLVATLIPTDAQSICTTTKDPAHIGDNMPGEYLFDENGAPVTIASGKGQIGSLVAGAVILENGKPVGSLYMDNFGLTYIRLDPNASARLRKYSNDQTDKVLLRNGEGPPHLIPPWVSVRACGDVTG